MKNLRIFDTKAEQDSYVIRPCFSMIKNTNNSFLWHLHDYSKDYLTYVLLEDDGYMTVNVDDIYISKDGVNWVTSLSNLKKGDKILCKGNDPEEIGISENCGTTIECSVKFNVEGNILSICDPTGFQNRTSLSGLKASYIGGIFFNTRLVSAKNLILPLTTLPTYAYRDLFSGCSLLKESPLLPATNLGEYCYNEMFRGCNSLYKAPKLPATTLVNGCYNEMFFGCTNLKQAPELPATTLVNNCYSLMFYNCTKLNYIKCLATNISATNCTDDWVNGVSAIGTFIKNSSMNAWPTGNNGIPIGWWIIEGE